MTPRLAKQKVVDENIAHIGINHLAWEVDLTSAARVIRNIPADDVTTGVPVARAQIREPLVAFQRLVQWTWPAHASDITFYVDSERYEMAGNDNSVILQPRNAHAPSDTSVASGEQPRSGYLRSALDIEVDGERTAVWVHPDDIRPPSGKTPLEHMFGFISSVTGWR